MTCGNIHAPGAEWYNNDAHTARGASPPVVITINIIHGTFNRDKIRIKQPKRYGCFRRRVVKMCFETSAIESADGKKSKIKQKNTKKHSRNITFRSARRHRASGWSIYWYTYIYIVYTTASVQLHTHTRIYIHMYKRARASITGSPLQL